MSAIRFAVLESLRRLGPAHGHVLLRELRTLAPDAAPAAGALYGVIDRLHRDGLISREVLTRVGNYPPRQEYTTTAEGLLELERLWTELWQTPTTSRPSIELALGVMGRDRMRDLSDVLLARAALIEVTLGPSPELRPGCGGHELAAHLRYFSRLGEVEWLQTAARAVVTQAG